MSGLKYCSFDGCLSTTRDKALSFFKLPVEDERRKKWLTTINRPDLEKPDLKPHSYVVCSKHFDKSAIIITRKLKADAIPVRFEEESKAAYDQATQTEDSFINILSVKDITKADNCSDYAQTDEKEIMNVNTQTSVDIFVNTPSKRKPSNSSNELNLKKKKLH